MYCINPNIHWSQVCVDPPSLKPHDEKKNEVRNRSTYQVVFDNDYMQTFFDGDYKSTLSGHNLVPTPPVLDSNSGGEGGSPTYI